jgi:hypothetical protein
MGKPKPYAGTTVPVGRTQQQIEVLIQNHGAVKSHFFKDFEAKELVFAWERKVLVDGRPMIQPLMHRLSFEDLKEVQAYRALFWHLKHKFEAVEFGIVTFEEEFLPYFVVKLPDGVNGTIAEYFVPELRRGALPPMRALDNPKLPSGNDYDTVEGK